MSETSTTVEPEIVKGDEGWGMAVSGLDVKRDEDAVGTADLSRLRLTVVEKHSRCLRPSCNEEYPGHHITPEAFVEMLQAHPNYYGFTTDDTDAVTAFARESRRLHQLPALLVCPNCKKVQFRSVSDNGSQGVFIRRRSTYFF